MQEEIYSVKEGVKGNIKPVMSINNGNLENLEETLEKLQLEFEAEMDLYEQNQEKLRRMKSNLLAVDFTETFLKDDDDDDEDENNRSSTNNSASLLGTPGVTKFGESPRNNKPREKSPGNRHTSPAMLLPEMEVINETGSDKENNHNVSIQRQNTYPYDRMQGMWEKIKLLEDLLESHRGGLKEKIDCIKKTEMEIKNISLLLNTSRSPREDERDEDHDRNSFNNAALQKSHERKNLMLLLPPYEQQSQHQQASKTPSLISSRNFHAEKEIVNNKNKKDPGADPELLELSVNLLTPAEADESRCGNLLTLETTMSPPTEELNVEIADPAANSDGFKITRTGWMMCIGLNVVVVLATITILIVNSNIK